MPNSPDEIVLCTYDYDPLDRQIGCTVVQQPAIQRFHCKSRLATEIQGAARWSFFQHDDHLLAQRNHLNANVTSTLLATDQQRSVLNALDAFRPNPLAYSPYGHRPAQSGLLSLLGFNGERPDPVTGHYHLGNGYRQFNPVLMRFNSPDGLSPFGRGGWNAYGYCDGEPVNRSDPTGHTWAPIKSLLRKIGVMKKPAKPENIVQIGAWQQESGNPELVQLPVGKGAKSKINKTMLTKKEEAKFRKEWNDAIKEGQAASMKALNNTTTNSDPSFNRMQSRNAPSNNSAISDTVEHMSASELVELERTASSWKNVGTERTDILTAVKREQSIRALNSFGSPPTRNRRIRSGEPGFSPR
ncbi:MAG: RHS repeat-associated core domain-containing protein [Pseudomonas sp.]|uniref:RHS repeat-associated core domain-containing protein n=1 Tax=Pseudomonas sp. TaxID=306 RepID=UPI003D6E64EE